MFTTVASIPSGILPVLPMPLLGKAWVHRLDPVLVHVGDVLAVRWYGIAYAAGFLVAYLLLRLLARSERTALQERDVGDLMISIVLGVILGGRLGWVVFYRPDALWTFTAAFPWWEVLAVNRGGMASHGGMIGVITAVLLFARSRRIGSLHLLDLCALVTPFGLLFGRLANFINGELLGRPTSDEFPLAVKFPTELYRPEWPASRYVDLVEAAPALGLTQAGFREILVQADSGPAGREQFAALRSALIEAVRAGDERVSSVLVPHLVPRHPSQLYQALAEGIVLAAILWIVWLVAKPKRPGLVGCTFLLAYGVMRVITERFRLPDVGVPVVAGLSRGQWLSVAMILVALVAGAIILTRPPRPISIPPGDASS